LLENDIHTLAGLAIINEEPNILNKVKEYLAKVNKLPFWDLYNLEWQQVVSLKS